MSVLISLLVVVLIGSLVWYLIGMLPLPPVARQIVQVILILIAILYLVGMLTGVGGLTPIRIS